MKWRLKEQAGLLKQLANLLEKGYSLMHSFEFSILMLKEPKKSQLQEGIEELKKGSSLHAVFSNLSFHSDILGYLYFAEQHGDIVHALRRSCTMMERKVIHASKLQKALHYPAFLLLLLTGMVLLFNSVLIPQFSSLYQSIRSPSPLSEGVLTILKFLPSLFLVFFVIVFIAVLAYYIAVKSLHPFVRMKLMMGIPIVRSFIISYNSHYFSEQVSSLLQGGLSVKEVFQFIEMQPHHSFFRWEAQEIRKLLETGEKLDDVLRNKQYYEKELPYVVTHGQASGNLGKELADYSEVAVEKVEQLVNRCLSIVQPILFSIIGIVIVMMYLAMLLPMFTMLNSM
ncbi:competence type IV pilus assembly protein ComGB [Ectobacillus sp. sgz5001026]|uniref:competence type IV pilus assembly protein ComGB n=1 Tax=Ectobacillus sp. sgz5001026 TaxID=3242473 RepID=UPI0036D3B990